MIGLIGWLIAGAFTGGTLFALAKREDEEQQPARINWRPGEKVKLDWDKRYWFTFEGIPAYVRIDNPAVVKVQWDPPEEPSRHSVIKLVPFAVGVAKLTINDEFMEVRVG